MLQSSTLQFLKDLKKHNTKEWFDKNRKLYDAAKADYLQMVGSLLASLQKIDTSLEHLEAKQCVFRINRDVRFSKDKSPYKTNMGASFNRGGKKVHAAGYYLHVEPGASFIAGGIWMPEAPALQKIRQEIDYNFEAFGKIIHQKKFVQTFGGLEQSKEYVLSRPPKGYEANNPAIEYLKFKSYIVSVPLEDERLTKKDLVAYTTSVFQQITPLIGFLNSALDD